MITLSFHGAAGTVTGSKYLLTVNDKKLLVDCGAFQGAKWLRQKNWTSLPFDPATVGAVALTHAHIDHLGYLPRLVAQGFTGPVYATAPTAELAKIVLIDAAHLQEEDAEYRNKKKLTSHPRALPLFTVADAEMSLQQIIAEPFMKWIQLGREIKFRYHIAGHILGAGSLEVELDDGTRQVSILFSGDVGRYAVPLIIDPAKPPQTDYLVCESTYGGEIHEPQDIFFEFAKIIDDIVARKSILLIPAFAVGRTQQIVYIVDVLTKQGRIRPIDIHIDSPMAVKVTDVYRNFPSYHSVDRELLGKEKNGFYSDRVSLHRKRKSSQDLNKLKGPAIIISASGMMTGGRIMHHLLNRLSDPNTTLLLVGFMAEGTIGRKILEGESLVYIHKTPVPVKAKIIKLLGLSGHADSYELLHWLEPIKQNPKKVFITHGEPLRSKAMADDIKNKRGWDTYIPSLDETVEL